MSTPVSDQTAEVGSFYDRNAEAFERVYGSVIQAYRTRDLTRLLDRQISSIGLRPGMRVLDAGCGVCGPAIHFASRVDLRIEALTISAVQAERAREAVAATGLTERIRVHHGDYQRLDALFETASFDAVCFLESFGHSPDQPALLRQVARVLKPGGVLFVKDIFLRLSDDPERAEAMAREVRRINEAYRYRVPSLEATIAALRGIGFHLTRLGPVDIPLEDFENLTVSNEFQELTGIARIQDWGSYVFPVEFFDLQCRKPWFGDDVDAHLSWVQRMVKAGRADELA